MTYHDADAGNALLTDADADTTGFQFSVYHVSNGITVRGHARNGKRTRDHLLPSAGTRYPRSGCLASR